MITIKTSVASLALALGAIALTAAVDVTPANAQWAYERFERSQGSNRWGPACVDRITTRGKASVKLFSNSDKKKASARAVENWSEQVAGEFGPQFANWQRARGQQLACSTHGFQVTCTASAHPCR